MEHGRVEIHYKPTLPESEQLALKGVFDADPDGVLLYPDPDMPYDVAVTAWTNEAVCPHYNPLVLDVIRNFRDTYRGNGPEQQIPIHLGYSGRRGRSPRAPDPPVRPGSHRRPDRRSARVCETAPRRSRSRA